MTMTFAPSADGLSGAIQIGGVTKSVIDSTGLDSGISINASVAANALTVTLNPCTLRFRSSSLTSGTVNNRSVSTPLTLTVSSGSTLGTVNTIQNRLVVIAIDNAGTVELAIANIAGGVKLDETNLISTTAEGGAGSADSATVVYSTTARTSVPYRVVGYVESTQATAGTWATAPSTIQGAGGVAMAGMNSLGYGQTSQNFTVGSTRVLNTTYYNTTGKPIIVYLQGVVTASLNFTTWALANGVSVAWANASGSAAASGASASFVVPVMGSYVVNSLAGLTTNGWSELR